MATHEGSLASKLLNIRVGETIAIPDTFDDGRGDPIKGASVGERSVQNLICKNETLKARKFSTKRGMFVGGTTYVQQMLLIERHMTDGEV